MKGLLKKLTIGLLAVGVLAAVSGKADVYAKTMHNVTYVYGDKSVTVQVAHGQNAPVPSDGAVPGYVFVSWVGSAVNVTEDRVILGAYNKIPTATAPTSISHSTGIKKVNDNKSAPWPEWWKDLNLPKGVPGVTCAVHWYNGHNGELWKTDIVPYGSSIDPPATPCIDGYQFVGWEGDWTHVTEDRAIRAWYYENFAVTFVDTLDPDDDYIDKDRAHSGEEAWVDAPHHSGYKFKGYVYSDGREYTGNVHDNETVYAVYEKKP